VLILRLQVVIHSFRTHLPCSRVARQHSGQSHTHIEILGLEGESTT
jgi:hypothetical protein